MKARVFVTLKPGVLDPQGKAIHHALEGLGFAGVQDVRAGKLIELELAEGTSDADIEAMCRKLLANTVIENFKIETDGVGMKSAVLVFPGSNCDRDLAVAIEQVTGRAPAMVWHRDSELPEGHRLHRHSRRLFLRRLSPLRRDGRAIADHGRSGRGGRPRRAGARHLQRLPGADRGRPSAGRADAQRRPALRLPFGRPQGRKQPVDLHQRLPGGRGDQHPGRSP